MLIIDTVMRHVRKCRQTENQNLSAENMMLELGQQDPDDPDRMWGQILSARFFHSRVMKDPPKK